MTAKNYRNHNVKGLGVPNLRSRQNAENCFFGEKFLRIIRKNMCSVSAVKVADFAQYLSGTKILF